MRISGEVKLPQSAEAQKKGNIRSLRHIMEYLRPYRWAVVGALLALIFTSSAVLGMGNGLRFLVDQGIGKGDAALLNQAFVILLSVILLLAFATYSRYYLVSWVGERVVADVRNDVYARLVSMDVGFFETNRTGDLLSRLMTDTTLLQTVVGSSVSVALRNALMLVGGIVMLLITSPRLTEYVLLIIPAVVVPIILLGKKVRGLSRDTQERVADVSAHAEETISAIRTIQALSLEKQENQRFGQFVAQSLAISIARIRVRALLIAIVISLVLGAVATVLWIGGRYVVEGQITAGELSAFVFYAMLVAASTGALSEVIGDLQRAAGAAERLMELKQMVPAICAPAQPATLPASIALPIRFEGVRFAYPSRPDVWALNQVSFSIQPGETVALVGPSGAGKSTVMQLLLRFYDIQEGRILLGETPINEYDPAELRGRLGLVPQDPVIFSTSAYENIRYGRPDADESAIRSAAQQAEALEFIEALPEGFTTYLGEKGVRISGGQRQRLAIARALVRNPELLLLDEATSALDSENERKVQAALEGLMRGRTTLVIAHRLSTVQNANRILVMDQGKIVAQGTHTALMQASELYQKLARRQFEMAA
ncbi:MAG: ATP-binding cassette domain-containing protein [Rickettsiales bacterium]|nr:ATP-binding cassette domain-containing protein [Rickettsiales bacterium]